MNGKRLLVLTLTLSFLTYGSPLFSGDGVESLRGETAIDTSSAPPEYKKWQGKTDPIARDFEEQPPLIPHKSQSQKINFEENKCLSCHGLEKYKEKEATKVSDTHFLDRDGKKLTNVSPARYFCTQCHVEQRDAMPLVENEYKSAGNTN